MALTAALANSALFGACDDLVISEYIEGSSYNKAIELFNPTSNSIDLSSYSLELYSNGNSNANATFALSGVIGQNGVTVISRTNADATIVAQSDLFSGSVINFNGDDAIVLRKDGAVVDVIGQIGVDPGSEYSANGVGTRDETLVRLSSDSCGDENAYDAFDPSLSFQSYPRDTFTFLGTHNGLGDNDGETEGENNSTTVTLIHDIQGSTNSSPLVGESVRVEAVVVADFTDTGMKGFFVEEQSSEHDANSMSSEGIFVYCGSTCASISLGDLVTIDATVTEYRGLTELTSATVTLKSSSNALPAPVRVTLPLSSEDELEALEGMRVEVVGASGSVVVNENYNFGRYGELTVADKRLFQFTQTEAPSEQGYAAHQAALALATLTLDDGSTAQNPSSYPAFAGGFDANHTIRSGYTATALNGVMDYRYGKFRLQPAVTGAFAFDASSNARSGVEAKCDAPRAMRIASYNVLNYFNTFDGCRYGVDGALANCRGADNAQEFARQRIKIIHAMLSIDADIFGLMEIENDGYGSDSALQDLVNGLNEALGVNQFAFVNVDAALNQRNALGTDAIKVAIIYNKNEVTPIYAPIALTLDDFDKNRVTLAQAFRNNQSRDVVAVAVNHLKSKGSACNGIFYDGVEDLNRNDGQGNCNLTRTHGAKLLAELAASQEARFAGLNVLMLGDFNAYAKEEPIEVLESYGFTNLEAMFESSGYSYIFKAESGTLDYAFANESLLKNVTNTFTWHSNTDEPRVLDYNTEYKSAEQIESYYEPSPFRASDHDPLIVDVEF